MNNFQKCEQIGRAKFKALLQQKGITQYTFTKDDYNPVDCYFTFEQQQHLAEIKVRSKLYDTIFMEDKKFYAMCNLIKQGKASEGWYVIFIDKDTYIFSLRDICKYLSSLQKQGIQPFHSGHFTRTTVGDQTTVTKQMCELPITLAKHYELH